MRIAVLQDVPGFLRFSSNDAPSSRPPKYPDWPALGSKIWLEPIQDLARLAPDPAAVPVANAIGLGHARGHGSRQHQMTRDPVSPQRELRVTSATSELLV